MFGFTRDKKPQGWERFPNRVSAPARFSKLTAKQLLFWSNKLSDAGMKYDERDLIIFWNILSAVYVLTEFEKMNITAMTAHEFSGASPKTGQRKYSELRDQGMLIISNSIFSHKEKFVTVSKNAGNAVLETFDEWTRMYDDVIKDYKTFRRKRGVILD